LRRGGGGGGDQADDACALSLVAKGSEFRSRWDADSPRGINVFDRILNALVLDAKKAELRDRHRIVAVKLRRVLKRDRVAAGVNPVFLQGKSASAGLPSG